MYSYYPYRRPSVPYVPTPPEVVRAMLTLARASSEDILYDLGCGDGRIPLIAVKEFGVRKAYCVEIREDLAEQARKNIEEQGFADRIEVVNDDMFKIPINDATIVTLFLLTSVNEMLRPKLEKELKPGARVVSHEFQMPGWRASRVETVYDGRISHTLYLYIIGEHEF